MRLGYRRALLYAKALDQDNYRDLVHDAFLYTYTRSGTNLFDEHEGYICRCIKWMWRWSYQEKTYISGGKKFEYQFETFDDSEGGYNPEEILIAKDFHKYFLERLKSKPLLKNFLNYLEHGYEIKEICYMMQISPQTASNYRKHLKQLSETLRSPFNGSRVIFPKKNKITRRVYESNPDKYSSFIYDPNNYECDKSEYYTLLVNPETKEYLLITEKK